jgi:hypothetical protein
MEITYDLATAGAVTSISICSEVSVREYGLQKRYATAGLVADFGPRV